MSTTFFRAMVSGFFFGSVGKLGHVLVQLCIYSLLCSTRGRMRAIKQALPRKHDDPYPIGLTDGDRYDLSSLSNQGNRGISSLNVKP